MISLETSYIATCAADNSLVSSVVFESQAVEMTVSPPKWTTNVARGERHPRSAQGDRMDDGPVTGLRTITLDAPEAPAQQVRTLYYTML